MTASSRRATLNDVAARAGVTKATASKVLNRRSGFSEATRVAVETAMRELDYLPITRERPPHGSGAIVVAFNTVSTLYSMKVLEGVLEGTRTAGIDLILASESDEEGSWQGPELNEAEVREMSDKGHLGVLMVTPKLSAAQLELFRRHRLPIVAIDAFTELQPTVVCVGSNHWGGGKQAAQLLLDLGHTRIAFVAGGADNPGLRERLAGFRELLGSRGVRLRPDLVSEQGFGTGYDATARMLGSEKPPTAIFASNDGDAFGVVRAIEEAGLRVPDDISVIGYDDTYSSLSPVRFLTTVRAPLRELGLLGVETLCALAAGRSPLSTRLQLSTVLVQRNSTAAPPGEGQVEPRRTISTT